MVMYEQLFIADEILQKCLLYIHALCIDVSNPERYTTSEDIAINFMKVRRSNFNSKKKYCGGTIRTLHIRYELWNPSWKLVKCNIM